MRASSLMPAMAALVALGFAQPASADTDPTTTQLLAEVKRLAQRVEELERGKAQRDKSLGEPTISAEEPELVYALAMRGQLTY